LPNRDLGPRSASVHKTHERTHARPHDCRGTLSVAVSAPRRAEASSSSAAVRSLDVMRETTRAGVDRGGVDATQALPGNPNPPNR